MLDVNPDAFAYHERSNTLFIDCDWQIFQFGRKIHREVLWLDDDNKAPYVIFNNYISARTVENYWDGKNYIAFWGPGYPLPGARQEELTQDEFLTMLNACVNANVINEDYYVVYPGKFTQTVKEILRGIESKEKPGTQEQWRRLHLLRGREKQIAAVKIGVGNPTKTNKWKESMWRINCNYGTGD